MDEYDGTESSSSSSTGIDEMISRTYWQCMTPLHIVDHVLYVLCVMFYIFIWRRCYGCIQSLFMFQLIGTNPTSRINRSFMSALPSQHGNTRIIVSSPVSASVDARSTDGNINESIVTGERKENGIFFWLWMLVTCRAKVSWRHSAKTGLRANGSIVVFNVTLM